MTAEKAQAIYAREWHQARYHSWAIDYDGYHANATPATRWCLAAKLFDIRVNTGPKQAAILLQRACNAYHGERRLVVDGAIGPKTRAVAKPLRHETALIAVLRGVQIGFYVSIATGARRKFLDGWINRALA